MADEEREPEFVSVTRWRREVLIEAGYPPEESLVLAERHDIDIHVAVKLLDQGCDVKTALRILF